MSDDGSAADLSFLIADRRARDSRLRGALAAGLIASTAIHAALFLVWGGAGTDAVPGTTRALSLVVLPPFEEEPPAAVVPPVDLPPPVEPVARPADPTLAAPDAPDPPGEPVWIAHEVPPRLLNADEVQTLLAASRLDGAGEAGSEHLAVLWLYVDRSGEVRKLQLRQSSGSTHLDGLVQEAARSMEFSPALNQGRTVAVWISQPVRFSFRGDAGGGSP